MSEIDNLLRGAVRATAKPLHPLRWDEIERDAAVRRRARRRRRGAGIGIAAAALAATLVLHGGAVGGSGPSPLERANAAVSAWPAGMILHTEQRTVSHFDQPVYLEDTWQLTSPPYTKRIVNSFVDGVPADTTETTLDADGNGAFYDRATNQVVETTNLSASWRPTGVDADSDSRATIQGWITRAHPTSLAARDVDGHHVLGFEAWGTERIFIDAQTYLPVMDQSFGMGTGAESKGYDNHYSYELLPDTPANRQLVDIEPQHPDAALEQLAGPAWGDALLVVNGASRTLVLPGA
jgi:hypothetical protein